MLNEIAPNLVLYFPNLLKALQETCIMVFSSGLIGAVVGIPLGVAMLVTSKGHILQRPLLHSILTKSINTLRSIPFVILIAAIPDIIRFFAGTTIGVKGAIVPLSIACIPFMAKQIELALLKVDKGIIEAYTAMGFTPFAIIWKVILREGLGGIIQAVTVSLISLLGFSAIAGTVGGGGLGDFAIRFGYNMFCTDIMVVTVIIIILAVFLIQWVGDTLYRKLNHN